MHLNFHTCASSPCNCLPFLLPTFSTSLTFLVPSPPLTLPSQWCQPPGLLDQRAILWDHLERPVEVEEVKGREGTRNGESVWNSTCVCVCMRWWWWGWRCEAESLGGGRVSGKEVFLSRSSAAPFRTQFFQLSETHVAHTRMRMYPCQCWEENNYKWSQGFRCWYPTWWFRLCKDPWVSAHPLSPTWSRAYNTLWSWRCSKKRMSYRIKWCSAVFICFPNVLNCMFHLCVCVCLCPLFSKEQSGEKTNNGTHYKLQLLYSNGEYVAPRPSAQHMHIFLHPLLPPFLTHLTSLSS